MFEFGSGFGFGVRGSGFEIVALSPAALWQIRRTATSAIGTFAAIVDGFNPAVYRAVGVKRFTDLRAWQACMTYKRAVYQLCEKPEWARDWSRRRQLEESVAGPPGHVAEGFGRFSPPDFARFLVIARSSLMESQNHLIDAVDKRYIGEDTRRQLNSLAEAALEEVTGLMEYLQSPEALRNARRARERRLASRSERRTQGLEPEPEPEPEPRSEKGEV